MIGLIVVSSARWAQKEAGKDIRNKICDVLKDVQGLKVLGLITDTKSVEAEIKEDGCIIAVATGGTERLIKTLSDRTDKPILLWAHPSNNSLASSLEVFSVLKNTRLFYSPIDSRSVKEIRSFIQVCEAINALESSKIGIVGGTSEWILTSPDEKEIKRFGPELIKIETEDLIGEMKEIDCEKAKSLSKKLKKQFGRVEVSENDILEAVRVYLAMKRLVSKHDLSAITIRCFDLLNHNCTACLGMSLCNDEGLVAGCEGDLQATLTMMVVSFLSGNVCWMANIARIDKDKNTVTLAHCTIGTRMITDLSKATLLPHMESGKGVAVRGVLKKGRVTLVRLGGNLDRMLIARGETIRSDMQEQMCRTQVEVQLEGNVEDYLENALGNHQILAYGDLEQELLDFCKFKGIEAIRVK
jgi:L-fucose isomerase-like protein